MVITQYHVWVGILHIIVQIGTRLVYPNSIKNQIKTFFNFLIILIASNVLKVKGPKVKQKGQNLFKFANLQDALNTYVWSGFESDFPGE